MLEKVKVILVDDDPDELYFMERGFEASGLFEVLGSVTSSHALHTFLKKQPRPEVIITDLNLDAKSGIQIASELHEDPINHDIRVVVLSVTTEEDRGPKLPGDTLFFPKPESLLDYKTFASTIYERLHTDPVNGRASAH